MDQPTSPIIDIEQGIKLAGGKPDLARDLFGMLISSLGDARSKIEQEYAAGDAQALFHEIHRLQGACRYCGVPALLHACQQAEAQVKASGLTHIDQYLATLYQQIEALEHWAANNTWQAP